jgi:BirA family transcriptional regulator, biotin operon repressor / biotin---[acetyl-CoA-carboxylase] ligase
MVNPIDYRKMKSSILKILSTFSPDPVSGQKISKELGVSRVAIWKQVQSLQDLGYPIQSTSKGYFLKKQSDCLYSWEFPELKDRVFYYPKLASTMDQAKHHALEGCPDFSVVIADIQEKGRGRLDRNWESQKGGLYFTLILRPEIPSAIAHQISFTASVCLVDVLRNDYQLEASIKWPNDILVGDQKICGMLCEIKVEADLVKYLNIGIGVNINNSPKIRNVETTSIKALVGKKISRKMVLKQFLTSFQNRLEANDFSSVLDQWRILSATLNREVEIKTTRETVKGKAIGINESGALVLETVEKQTQLIYFGDCFHLN